ncbi:serine/threonine-protein kinase [Paenibacillus oryzisoli]|uniref:serine/threonine-protein kinase n=1 Tax=Paenibacillus oryzisoli TaxID=1850517 RepID=UPI003D2DB2A6
MAATVTVDQIKNVIREHFKKSNVIPNILGEIVVSSGIGQGGNALVFEAKWGNNPVALKVLAEDCSQSITTRTKRFFTEVREIIQLSDTSAVVPIYHFDFIEINDLKLPYMIMRFYPYTLKSWLEVNPIDNLEELLPIMIQLMNCINVIHSNNIIHRDLKPENILMSENGKLVLGDFGIAWFDPEHYERITKTTTGERLANYAFSPPEQFEKRPIVKSTNDIYAFGQIIQWIITGETHKGTGRHTLASVDSSLAPIDSIINSMLQQDPLKRPQTIGEVKMQLEESLKPKRKNEYETVYNDLQKFNAILREAFPGTRGIFNVNQAEKIELVLSLLSANVGDINLWWTQGYSNSAIPEIKKLPNGLWLIEGEESDVEEIWINKTHSYNRDFILLKTRPMQPFGLYNNLLEDEYEEAGLHNGVYIKRSEFDDGFAIIDGKSVKLDASTELRTRHLVTEYKFIITNSHSLALIENDEITDTVYEGIKQFPQKTDQLLAKLNKTKIHPVSAMHK